MINIPTEVTCLAITTSGKYVATGGSDQVVRVWSVESADIALTLYAPAGVNSVAFNADSSQIIAGTEDGLVLLWELPGKEQRVLLHRIVRSVWTLVRTVDCLRSLTTVG